MSLQNSLKPRKVELHSNLQCCNDIVLTLQWTYQIITERWNKNCQTSTQFAEKKKGKNQKYPEDEVGSIDLVVLPNSKGFRFHYFKLSTKGQSIVLVN